MTWRYAYSEGLTCLLILDKESVVQCLVFSEGSCSIYTYVYLFGLCLLLRGVFIQPPYLNLSGEYHLLTCQDVCCVTL